MKKCLLMASLAVVTASVLGMPFDTMNNNRFTNNVVRIRLENTLELLPKTQRTCLLNNIRQKNLDLVKNSLKNLSKKGIASIINQDKGKIIFSAFNEQNADIIQFLLEQEGVDVNIQDSDGNNPLHLACFYGYEKSAEFLIKKENVEINEKNAGNTLLHRTYFFMRDKIAEFLSKRKNIINEKNKYGCTPLHYACGERYTKVVEENDIRVNKKDILVTLPFWEYNDGHAEIVKLLLERDDIRVNEKDVFGATPMCFACGNGHTEIVRLLLERDDIRVNEKDVGGVTPLHEACERGNIEIVKLLLERDDIRVNEKDEDGRTPLHLACDKGYIEIVKLLLERDDIRVNEKNEEGYTPLHFACHKKNTEIVKLLLERDDIRVNEKDVKGKTPLYYACEIGNIEIVKLLLEREDININEKENTNGCTPLHLACDKGYIEIVKLLLERNDININEINKYMKAPVYYACNNGHTEMVKLLLKKGAMIVNEKNEEGYIPLYWAFKMGHTGIVKLLLERDDININERGIFEDTPLYWNLETTNFHLQKVINEKSKEGYTPLCWVCKMGYTEIVKLLLERNDININEKDVFGATPLCFACGNGHTEIVKLLLERDDIRVNEKDIHGDTPLYWACGKGYTEIVKLLLNHKDIDVNIKNSNGESALDIVGDNIKIKEIFSVYFSNSIFEAFQIGWMDRVKFLIERDKKYDLINERDIRGNTLLLQAVKDQNVEMVKYLLEQGANVNMKGEKGNIALHLAVMAQNLEIVKLLKQYNADATIKNKSQNTPLKIAKSLNQKFSSNTSREIFYILGGKPSSSDSKDNKSLTENRKNLFFNKIKENKPDQIKELLKKTPELIKKVDEHGRTPLVAALAEKKLDTATFLLEKEEIDLTSKDIYGNTALMYATKNKYPNIIESILKKLDNPSKRILERNKDGKNSLELAMFRPSNFSKFKKEQKSKALEKRATIMRLLLEHLSPEEKAEEMFFAIKNNLWDAAEMILNSGADVTQKDGSAPSLILALKTKERSNRKEKLEFIKVLIANKDIRLDAEDENGCTALSYAVANQYWEIIDLLVGEKVKISFKLVEEINDQDILDQIVQLGLKPYKEKKSELIKVTNKNEQRNVEQRQERYKLKFMSSSLKDYQNSSLNRKVKEGILEIMKLLKIDPYEVAKKALHGKYGTTDFGDNGYVRAYSAHTKSTKHGRVAYIVIEKLKEVWIIAANDSHYDFMKNKNSSLKDLLNKANFEDFDLNDSDKTISQDNQRDGKNGEENESTLQNNSESSSLSYSSGYETEAELDDKSFGTPEEINTSSIAE